MGRTLTRVAAPQDYPVSINDFKAHMRLDDEACSEDGSELIGFIAAASESIDGAAGWLGRALITQTWRLDMAAADCRGEIVLPLPPFIEVVDIKYTDTAGVEQTIAPENYRVTVGDGIATVSCVDGISWPSTADRTDALRITYKCGYGAARAVPAPIKTYIKMLAAEFYNMREFTIIGTISNTPPHLLNMLEGYRVRGLLDDTGTAL